MSSARVLVSVLSRNSAQSCLATLRSLSNQTYPEIQLQLIDSASTDGTATQAAKEFPFLDIKTLSKNPGYTGGCNLAIRQARAENYDYVLLCTHDVEVDNNAIENLVETSLKYPNAGVVGGVEFSAPKNKLRASGGGHYSKWFSRQSWIDEEDGNDQCEVFCVHGAMLLLTGKALGRDVLMDEHLFMYFDEADLGFQLKQEGLSAVVDRRVWIRHAGGARIYTPAIGYLMQRNRLYMINKHAAWYQRAFYLLYSSLVELPAKFIVRSLQGRTRFATACVRGQIDGLLKHMGLGQAARYLEEA